MSSMEATNNEEQKKNTAKELLLKVLKTGNKGIIDQALDRVKNILSEKEIEAIQKMISEPAVAPEPINSIQPTTTPSTPDTNKISNTKNDIEEILEIKEGEEQIVHELETVGEGEKKNIFKGLNTIGFKVEQKKNEFFAKAVGLFLAKNKSENTTSKFVQKLQETFTNDAKKAQEKITNPSAFTDSTIFGKTIHADAKKITSNVGLLVGNILKYGRTVADVTGASIANPFRYVMAGGMFATRMAEASKETRFSSEEVLEQTRINDIDQAWEEAYEIYERARAKAGDREIETQDLKNAYLQSIPANLQKRLSEPESADSFVQKILRKDIITGLERLQTKIEKIQDDDTLTTEQKELRVETLIASQKTKLEDYDRMVTQYGTVDELAATLRYTQKLGKGVVLGMQVETAIVSVEKLWGKLAHALSSHGAEVATGAQVKTIQTHSTFKVLGEKKPEANYYEDLKNKGFIDVTKETAPNISHIPQNIEQTVVTQNVESPKITQAHTEQLSTKTAKVITVSKPLSQTHNLHKDFVPNNLHTNDTKIPQTINHGADQTIKIEVPKDQVIQTSDAPHTATETPIDDGEGLNHEIKESSEAWIKPETQAMPSTEKIVTPLTQKMETATILSTSTAVTSGDIAPLERVYNTGGVADIAPNQPLGGSGLGVEVAHNPYENIPNQNHLTHDQAFNYKPGTEHLEQVKLTPDNAWDAVKASPEKGLHNAKELENFFGENNVVYDEPASNIQGMSYEEWHTASDKLFADNKFPFTSYDHYQKETTLQELFGHGKKSVEAVTGTDGILRNERTYEMQYFKNAPEWKTVSKIPAQYFFDFENPTTIDGNALSPEEIKKLVDQGVLIESTPLDGGAHTYEFAHKKELLKLSKLYKELVPKADRPLGNDKPIGNESIESYIARITKKIHKTINGSNYGVKDHKIAVEKIRKFRLGLSGSLRIGNSGINFGPGGTNIYTGFNTGWY